MTQSTQTLFSSVRLHNENSKLLSKTLYADEGMSHMTEAFNAMETERQNIEVEVQKKYQAVFRRQQHEIEVLKQVLHRKREIKQVYIRGN